MSIFEYNNSLSSILCDVIIEQFEEISEKSSFNIPKSSKKWKRIEDAIYKEILVRLNEYKIKLLLNINLYNDEIQLLNNTLYTKDITIQKIDIGNGSIQKYNFTPNRYNVLTYIFYLNDVTEGGEVCFVSDVIKPKKGKLVLFFEDVNKFEYTCTLPKNTPQYIITGQLCYKNIC